MGGRLALHLAVQQPELVRRLVLVSATAGIDDDTERTARRAADERLADDARDDRRPGVPRPLAGARRLFATLPPDASGADDRRRNTAAGLAASLRLAGTGTQQPLWDRLPAPHDARARGRRGARRQVLRRWPGASSTSCPAPTLAIVPGAGHTVHLERPDEFAELVGRWLDR